ncbi:hypothetical protein FPV67DRAFT_1679974 [Lyophyllum atratum]|nr:hypothetical protein FPV67DRAFT_1679974 [Lyophyllum atratum]
MAGLPQPVRTSRDRSKPPTSHMLYINKQGNSLHYDYQHNHRRCVPWRWITANHIPHNALQGLCGISRRTTNEGATDWQGRQRGQTPAGGEPQGTTAPTPTPLHAPKPASTATSLDDARGSPPRVGKGKVLPPKPRIAGTSPEDTRGSPLRLVKGPACHHIATSPTRLHPHHVSDRRCVLQPPPCRANTMTTTQPRLPTVAMSPDRAHVVRSKYFDNP